MIHQVSTASPNLRQQSSRGETRTAHIVITVRLVWAAVSPDQLELEMAVMTEMVVYIPHQPLLQKGNASCRHSTPSPRSREAAGYGICSYNSESYQPP